MTVRNDDEILFALEQMDAAEADRFAEEMPCDLFDVSATLVKRTV